MQLVNLGQARIPLGLASPAGPSRPQLIAPIDLTIHIFSIDREPASREP
jgi:hypothetical protein